MTTIRALEHELAATLHAAQQNGVAGEQWWRALCELAGLDPGDVEEHARHLAHLAGDELAAGWLVGIQVGIAAALKADLARLTHTAKTKVSQDGQLSQGGSCNLAKTASEKEISQDCRPLYTQACNLAKTAASGRAPLRDTAETLTGVALLAAAAALMGATWAALLALARWLL